MSGIEEVAAIAAVVGTVVSAVGAIQQGAAAKSAADYNAQVAAQNEMIAKNSAEFQAEQQQRAARLKIGAAEANYGASGVTTEGSPLDVLESSARNSELDRQTLIYQGQIRAAGYTDGAQLDTLQGDQAMSGGIFDAAGKLVGGASKFLTKGPGTPIPVNYAFLSSSYDPLAPFGGGAIPT